MLLDYARLTLDANGQPRSDHYQDIYYNPGAGFAESEHVFINGNRLHERLAHACDLTIGEIGYGTGLNFIHTADTFLREAPPEARLHYLSFELHPIATDTLAVLQRDWPQPAIRAAVLAQNPHNHPGHHLLKVHPRIHLHLIQGDIRATLPQLRARVDAWYLDGFAPAKNPECWTPELLAALARRSAPGATAATFSAARSVRDALTQAELDKARQEVVDQFEGILKMDGPENAHKLHHELGDLMYKYVSIERDNNGLDQCLVELKEILKRWDNIGLTDRGHWANQEAMFVRQLRNMILYAMCITKAARCRDESRGAHAKIALDANGKRMMDGDELVFMPRDDKNFMRISIVDYDPKTEEPIVSYDEFDHSLIKPRARNYAVAKKE